MKRTEPPSNVFRALADPTRREILQMLRKGALNSGEIADCFEATWPTISRHLAVLHAAGLVGSVRHKQEIRYELNTSVVQDLARHLIDSSCRFPTPSPSHRSRSVAAHARRRLDMPDTPLLRGLIVVLAAYAAGAAWYWLTIGLPPATGSPDSRWWPHRVPAAHDGGGRAVVVPHV